MKKFFRRLSALFFGVFAAPIVLIVCFFLIPDLRVISDEMGPHAFVLFLGLVFGSYLGGFLNKSPKLALLAMVWGIIVSVIAIVMIIKFPGEGWAALGHMLAFIPCDYFFCWPVSFWSVL